MSNEHNYEKNNENSDQKKENYGENKILKYTLIILAVFAGVFCATYFVVDMSMHRLGLTPFVVTFNELQKLVDKDIQNIEKSTPSPVKIDVEDDKYIITVNLKDFDNNPDNIGIDINNNTVKLAGIVKTIKNGEMKDVEFYQNVVFPRAVNQDKITKVKKGTKYIITLPVIKEENNENND